MSINDLIEQNPGVVLGWSLGFLTTGIVSFIAWALKKRGERFGLKPEAKIIYKNSLSKSNSTEQYVCLTIELKVVSTSTRVAYIRTPELIDEKRNQMGDVIPFEIRQNESIGSRDLDVCFRIDNRFFPSRPPRSYGLRENDRDMFSAESILVPPRSSIINKVLIRTSASTDVNNLQIRITELTSGKVFPTRVTNAVDKK